MGFNPFGRRGFQPFNKLCHRASSFKSNGQMDMIGDTSHPKAFAMFISGHRRKVGKKCMTGFVIEDGGTIFGAENDMHEKEGE